MSGQAACELAAGAGLVLTGAALLALWRGRRPRGNHQALSSLSEGECARGRHFHVFFSHDWGDKHHNHARVRRIYERLRDLSGLSVWFDEEHMRGDLDESMCKGIEASEVFAAFITEKYLQKVAGEDLQDNCKKEFNVAKNKLGPNRMVVHCDGKTVPQFSFMARPDWHVLRQQNVLRLFGRRRLQF